MRATFGAMVEAGELDAGAPAPAPSRATPCPPLRRRRPSTGSSPRRCSSTSPTTWRAMRELARVLRPGGHDGRDRAALRPRVRQLGALRRVPRRARAATSASTGARRCGRRLASAGLVPPGTTTPTACTPPTGGCAAWSGPTNDTHPAVAAYHRVLVWDIVKAPLLTRTADRVLSPLIGKSLVALPAQARCRGPGRPTPGPSCPRRPGRRGPTTPTQGRRHDDRRVRSRRTVPEVPGVLSASDVLATAHAIAEVQRADGMIPWFAGGHCDPWNHVEAAMALTVCGLPTRRRPPTAGWPSRQLADGSWFNYYLADGVKDPRLDTNVCAYMAAGLWHHHLVTGDAELLRRAVAGGREGHRLRAALAAARRLGALVARPGRPARGLRPADRLLVDLPLACAARWPSPSAWARTAPTGSWPPAGSATPWPTTRAPSPPRSEFAMDWYYPMLSGALEGEAGPPPHRRGLVDLRHGGPRGALRLDRRLGHRGRDGRVRAGARRAGPATPAPRTCSPPPRACGCPTARTGPGWSTPTRRPSPSRAHHLHVGGHRPGRRRPVEHHAGGRPLPGRDAPGRTRPGRAALRQRHRRVHRRRTASSAALAADGGPTTSAPRRRPKCD